MVQQPNSRRSLLIALLATIPVLALVLFTLTNGTLDIAFADQDESIALPLVFGTGFRPAGSLDESFFGVQMYTDTRAHSKYNQAAQDSGAGTVRVLFGWPSDSRVDTTWDGIDRRLAIAGEQHGGKTVIAVMDSAPSWAAPSRHAPLYEHAYDDLADFMRQIVERYDGDGIDDAPGSPVVEYWELYNEPDKGDNVSSDRRWGNVGDQYAEMLRTIYPEMKAASRDAKVVLGGIAYDWFEDDGGVFVRTFIDDVLAAGGCDYFDVMNFHAYPSFNYNWTNNQGAGLYEKAVVLYDRLAEYNCVKPMIITEAGWHSNAPEGFPSNYEHQARYVVQLFVQSAAADLDLTIWWMLYDPGRGYNENGLVTDDETPQPKPSFGVFQRMVDTLTGTFFEERYTAAELGNELLELYRFDDPVNSRTIYIGWLNPVDSDASDTVQVSGERATLRSIHGATSVVNDSDDGRNDGKLTVEVTAQPIYIEVQR